MERAEEIAMFRTALEVAGLPPNAATLPADHQSIIGAMRFHHLDWSGPERRFSFCTAAD